MAKGCVPPDGPGLTRVPYPNGALLFVGVPKARANTGAGTPQLKLNAARGEMQGATTHAHTPTFLYLSQSHAPPPPPSLLPNPSAPSRKLRGAPMT